MTRKPAIRTHASVGYERAPARSASALALLTAMLALAATALASQGPSERLEQGVESPNSRFVGTWYLALDAEPYGAPPGTNLPGILQFHDDHTLRIVDGGDLGGPPFTTRDTAQVGSWRALDRGEIEATTLILQGDATTGLVLHWLKGQFRFQIVGRDTVIGTVNVLQLDCDASSPLPLLSCPDPIAAADEFVELPPFDVPVVLRRLRAGE